MIVKQLNKLSYQIDYCETNCIINFNSEESAICFFNKYCPKYSFSNTISCSKKSYRNSLMSYVNQVRITTGKRLKVAIPDDEDKWRLINKSNIDEQIQLIAEQIYDLFYDTIK